MNKGFVHLFLVIVIVLMGIGGLLYYSWQKGLIKTTPIQETFPYPTPGETADWETVLNEQVGISFRYPADIFPYTNNLPIPPDYSFFGFNAFNNEEKPAPRMLTKADLVLEMVVYKPANFDLEEYRTLINSPDGTTTSAPIPGGSAVKVKSTIQGNIQTVIVYSEPANEYSEYDAFIINGNNLVWIRLMTGSHNKRGELLPLLDQILSTFQFTE